MIQLLRVGTGENLLEHLFGRVRKSPLNDPNQRASLPHRFDGAYLTLRAADPPGDLAAYEGDRLVTLVQHGRIVSRVEAAQETAPAASRLATDGP